VLLPVDQAGMFDARLININPNESAAATYTGTIARETKAIIFIFSSIFFHHAHHLPDKKKLRAKRGEKIAYIQSIAILVSKATAIAIISNKNARAKIIQNASFLNISTTFFIVPV